MSLSLANVRDPRHAKLSRAEQAQWKALQAQEGFDADDDELSVKLVDVVAGEGTAYQLYLWPSGSAALFADGKTKPIGGAEQHAFHVDDAQLLAEIAAAWRRSSKQLGLREVLRFAANPKATTTKPTSSTNEKPTKAKATKAKPTKTTAPAGASPATLDAIRALALAGKRNDVTKAVQALTLFTPWRHYPKLLVSELSTDQRAIVELLVDVNLARDLANNGLFDRHKDLLRFLGRAPAGPSDVTIQVGTRTVPIWWAVSAVGSGHARAEDVSAGWAQLPAAEALAAWSEIARGAAYDVLTAHATSMKDAGFSSKPYMLDYRSRIVTLLADVSFRLRADGAQAAQALATELPSRGGAAQVFVALASGLRHAGGAPLPPEYDATFTKLWERVVTDVFHVPAVERAIEAALPAPRAKAFRAGLTR